jgi:hypothetical protein
VEAGRSVTGTELQRHCATVLERLNHKNIACSAGFQNLEDQQTNRPATQQNNCFKQARLCQINRMDSNPQGLEHNCLNGRHALWYANNLRFRYPEMAGHGTVKRRGSDKLNLRA